MCQQATLCMQGQCRPACSYKWVHRHLMARLDISTHPFNVGMLQESCCVEIAYKKTDMQLRLEKKSRHLLTYITVEMMRKIKC